LKATVVVRTAVDISYLETIAHITFQEILCTANNHPTRLKNSKGYPAYINGIRYVFNPNQERNQRNTRNKGGNHWITPFFIKKVHGGIDELTIFVSSNTTRKLVSLKITYPASLATQHKKGYTYIISSKYMCDKLSTHVVQILDNDAASCCGKRTRGPTI
jgi:hypothetical protein